MSMPTAEEVRQKALRLTEIADELDQLAPGLEILSPGFREVLRNMADTLSDESDHLAELHQWMTGGPPPGQVGALSAWLRGSRRAGDHMDSRSRSPVRGAGRQSHQS